MDLDMQFSIDPADIAQRDIPEQGKIQRFGIIQQLQARHLRRAEMPVFQDALRNLRGLHAFHSFGVLLQHRGQVCLIFFEHLYGIHLQRNGTFFRGNRLIKKEILRIECFMFFLTAVQISPVISTDRSDIGIQGGFVREFYIFAFRILE